jgi:ribonuclease III
MARPLEDLEVLLKYTFSDRALLERALTHRSLSYEQPETGLDNERLEFLGDAVLGFLVSAALFERGPHLPEGKLSKIKSFLVSSVHLHEAAQEMELGDFLRLGKSEEMSGGRGKKALLADAIEALIAALYLDGGIEAARGLVDTFVLTGIDMSMLEGEFQLTDHKGALQELAQALRLAQPRYTIVNEHGPEHAKIFTVEARVGDEVRARAEGPSKKVASQRAAEQAFLELKAAQPETAPNAPQN